MTDSFLDTLPELRRERLKPQDAPDQIAWLTRWQAQETIRLSNAVRLLEQHVDNLSWESTYAASRVFDFWDLLAEAGLLPDRHELAGRLAERNLGLHAKEQSEERSLRSVS